MDKGRRQKDALIQGAGVDLHMAISTSLCNREPLTHHIIAYQHMKFIPTIRHVADDLAIEAVTDEQELVIEYRDETNRPWWKFFDEYEYRQNSYEKSGHKWFKWFDERDTKEDKKLILKLDLLLTCYSLAVYWVKYLDQTNVNNAYVSGMREDLGFKGNDLVNVQAMYLVGELFSSFPSCSCFPKCR